MMVNALNPETSTSSLSKELMELNHVHSWLRVDYKHGNRLTKYKFIENIV
jgi:hypothetical protein